MGKKRKHLSHEEIWDDSALVNSWNEALEEYKLYHSIHAKGERVEDVIRDHEDSLVDPNGNHEERTSDVDGKDVDDELQDGEWVDGAEPGPAAETSLEATTADDNIMQPNLDNQQIPTETINVSTSSMPVPAPFPSHLEDEALKNLMMSWYWSGYYTGFYQGQQQGQRQAQSKLDPST